MIERMGDLFSMVGLSNQVICITTNGVISNGRLVMGKGIALAAKKRWPSLDYVFGRQIVADLKVNAYPQVYHLVQVIIGSQPIVGLQTKLHWHDPSTIDLVAESLRQLGQLALRNPTLTYNLPRPGIGLGGLVWREVKPYCDLLPDNCVVWAR